MEKIIGPSFKKTKALCYKNNEHGFCVYAKPDKCDPKTVVKYIAVALECLLSRSPALITMLENVTFHYNRHEDDAYVEETLPAMDFIRHLIRHIPEKHFKLIRYSGLYARHRESHKNSDVPFQKKNILSFCHLINGTPVCCPLLAAIPLNVRNVVPLCSSLNYT